MKNNSMATGEKNDKCNCFAWISKTKCNALSSKNCKGCSFYKDKNDVPNYQKYLLKKDVK